MYYFILLECYASLYEAEDPGPLMETVAVSLPDYIRNISSTRQYGTLWREKTYVHIRWLWLILSMTLSRTLMTDHEETMTV